MSFTRKLLAGVLAGGTVFGGGWLLLRDQTTDNDKTGEDFAPPPPVGHGGLGARAVEVGNRLVGTKGLGPKGSPGYHRGPVIDEILRGLHNDAGDKLIGKPWCARTIRYLYEVAAKELGLPPPFPKKLGRLAVVHEWRDPPFDKYKLPLSSPKVGAVLLLGKRHSTLIAKIVDDKTVITVEGNHGDRIDNVKRVLKDEDTIVDVEAYVMANQPSTVGAGWTVVGALHMLGSA